MYIDNYAALGSIARDALSVSIADEVVAAVRWLVTCLDIRILPERAESADNPDELTPRWVLFYISHSSNLGRLHSANPGIPC